MATFHASQVRADIIFLADSFLGPLHGEFMLLGEGFHPAVVIIGSLSQDLLVNGLDLVEVAEEVEMFRCSPGG